MAYEKGGRADKFGNRYEFNWAVRQLLDVLSEKKAYIEIEAIGEDEHGIDLWVGNLDGTKEGQQCKSRHGSKESWTFSMIKEKGIMTNWKNQLSRDDKIHVSLISPLSFTLFEDITQRAKNTNGNYENFYNDQIKNSGANISKGYIQYCDGMEIDFKNEEGIKKSIDFLSRTSYRQAQDTDNKDLILDKIDLLFHGNPEKIYDSLLSLIVSENIFSKKIDIAFIYKFIEEKKLTLKNLAKDTRILPKILELNKEYRDVFVPFNTGIIERNNLKQGIELIKKGNSFILHGKAGIGKSGYTENIINYCESESIPYLAIKLDKRRPSDTTDRWGASMGLPASPLHCLNAISSDRSAVLILDQLDALRWTQTHSSMALEVCLNIIREANNLNVDRSKPISIIIVTRTYDLKNDRAIKHFVECSNAKYIIWDKIQMDELTDDEMEDIVGDVYTNFSIKMKRLLKIPNNLYIWQKLDSAKSEKNINTTRQLVQKWNEELQDKANLVDLDTIELINIQNKFVDFCNNKGRINAPITIIQSPNKYLEFMQSNGLMIVKNNLISFIHQSILDVFLSEYMLRSFYDGINIEAIVGNKNQQTPGKRYQLQLFMEQLLESSEQDFIKVGKLLLDSKNIRWNFKYIFIELLNTLENPSNYIIENVIEFINVDCWRPHFIDNVVRGKKCYIDELQKKNIFEQWFHVDASKDTVINLFCSISDQIDNFNISFIKKFIFINTDTDQKWAKYFDLQFNKENDDFFELRMEFYTHYPKYLDTSIDLKEMLEECEIRVIRILVLILNVKYNKSCGFSFTHTDAFDIEDSNISINYPDFIVDEFTKLLPSINDNVSCGDCYSADLENYGIERTCIQILKKANSILAFTKPEKFLEKYESFKSTGYDLYNEIYLDALYYLPDEYADKIIIYLCSDFNMTMFESTSGSENKLFLANKLLSKTSKICNKKNYELLEKSIICFIPKGATDLLKRRIEFNKERNGVHVYWDFWGDFQYECLKALPEDKLSKEAAALIRVLNRKMQNSFSSYNYDENGGFKNIVSPVSGKKLSPRTWVKIITNMKINDKTRNWKETKNSFIESSRDSFVSSFQHEVSKEPLEFLNYMLTIEVDIHEKYIDSLYSGIAYSDSLDGLDNKKIEKLFVKFPCNDKSQRALSMCRILEYKLNYKWSEDTMEKLIDLSYAHEDPKLNEHGIVFREDINMEKVSSIESYAKNCVRGVALCAMGKLLFNKEERYPLFKPVLKKLINDSNPIIQYACLYALWPICKIDENWAAFNILKLMKKDIRMCGFQYSRKIFHLFYKNYSDEICPLVLACFNEKNDERLISVGAFTIVEWYLMYNKFEEIVLCNDVINENQEEKLLQMLITYFNYPEYNEKVKKALLFHLSMDKNSEFPWTRLFNEKQVNLDRDIDFIKELLNSKKGYLILNSFIKYLEGVDATLLEVSDIIFSISNELIQSTDKDYRAVYGVQNKISNLIIGLYDASCGKSDSHNECIAMNCLDIWDSMYEKNIGMARRITNTLMDM